MRLFYWTYTSDAEISLDEWISNIQDKLEGNKVRVLA